MTNFYPQLPQLLLADWSGRVHHQISRLRGLGEWDHLAQALRPGQDHHNAIQTQRDAAMRRRAILQRLQKKAEARARLIFAQAKRAKNLPLHILAMDTDGARAQLSAVQYDIVGPGADRA